MQRIAIIGASRSGKGSGKTTLGRKLARLCALPFTDLDDLYWQPGWRPAPEVQFQASVAEVVAAEHWVIAGNFAAVRGLVWPRMDTLLWLDLPLARVLLRSTRRALRHWWTRESICNGNQQTLAQCVYGRDSLLGYTLRTYHSRRRDWSTLITQQPHARVLRLTSAREIDAWLAQLQRGNTPVDR